MGYCSLTFPVFLSSYVLLTLDVTSYPNTMRCHRYSIRDILNRSTFSTVNATFVIFVLLESPSYSPDDNRKRMIRSHVLLIDMWMRRHNSLDIFSYMHTWWFTVVFVWGTSDMGWYMFHIWTKNNSETPSNVLSWYKLRPWYITLRMLNIFLYNRYYDMDK